MATEITRSIRYLLDELVQGVPGVVGALVSSVDGFALASNTLLEPPTADARTTDDAGLAAMSAAVLGVSNRLVGVVGREPVQEVTLRSPSGHVLVYRIANVAALTVLTDASIDVEHVKVVSRVVTDGIDRLLCDAPSLASSSI